MANSYDVISTTATTTRDGSRKFEMGVGSSSRQDLSASFEILVQRALLKDTQPTKEFPFYSRVTRYKSAHDKSLRDLRTE